MVLASVRNDVREGTPEEKEKTSLEVLLKIFKATSELSKMPPPTPSSVMLQVMNYGKTFKRVIEVVEVDYDAFERQFQESIAKLMKSGGKLITPLKNAYAHGWREQSGASEELVSTIMEPFQRLNIADFTHKQSLKVNKYFAEAVDTYVNQERVQGVSFFNKDTGSLTIYSKVVGQTKARTIANALQDYYVLLRLERLDNGRLKATFSCTCPWALGFYTDERRTAPEYTSICKHGLATLFYFFPEILAYMSLVKNGKFTKSDFEEEVSKTRKAYEEFRERLENHVRANPDQVEVIYSNISYLMWREFYNTFSKNGEIYKLVPPVLGLGEFEKMWRALSLRKVTEERVTELPPSSGPGTEEVLKIMRTVEDSGLYERLNTLRKILNGLQGSRTTTLYTKALLASLVLGSDLESDPVIVSVVGDPGTGKTLTAEGLARIIGFRTIVVEREVNREDLLKEADEITDSKLSHFMEFFEKSILSRIPKDRSDEARNFFVESVNYVMKAIDADKPRELIRISKRFGKMFADAFGITSKRAILDASRLYYSILKSIKKVREEYVSDKTLERKALEERRNLLKVLSDVGLISSPEEKENVNSGSVKWEVIETAKGYKIRVFIDLHYMLRRCDNVEKMMEIMKRMGELGEVYVKIDVPGISELKLSEAEYLEKAIKVREEDILSPAKRLIWVGGSITKASVILIDESRRAPELLERLLTDLSTAGRDTRRTNIVITTDNAEPLMEAESDPRLDAFHSRINFEVFTPSPTVASIINETLREISELEHNGRVPLITADEALVMNYLSRSVQIPEKYEKILYSVPLLLVYDFKVSRPEVVSAALDASGRRDDSKMQPLILLIPKGAVDVGEVKGDYEVPSWGREIPPIRMMPERRFGHHVVRASKVLSVIDKKLVVDEETFLSSLEMVLMSRVIPIGHGNPYLYLDMKKSVTEAILGKVKEFLMKEESATEKLIEVLGSMSPVSQETLTRALEEMCENPVAVAVFVRFLEQMLVSEHSKEFVKYSKEIPGLHQTLELISRYEKIYVPL